MGQGDLGVLDRDLVVAGLEGGPRVLVPVGVELDLALELIPADADNGRQAVAGREVQSSGRGGLVRL